MGLILPYRAGVPELAEWVGARARGRTPPAGETGAGAAKAAEGAAATAAALGLADGQGELTPDGRRFALAPEEERREILRAALLRFAPYSALLEAVRERGDAATEAEWIETWWSTRGYGGSASNRHEGVAAFGRLVDSLGLGRYVPGRRGHPTRVEWLRSSGPEPVPAGPPLPPLLAETQGEPDVPRDAARFGARPPEAVAPDEEVNRLVVPLGEGRQARIEVPARLPRSEKRRLLELLELLIGER